MSEKKTEEDFGELSLALEEDVEMPKKFSVVLHNDHFTTMEFVVEVLMKYFAHTEENAQKLMLEVHQKGKGVAGVYPFEVAETKVAQVRQDAVEAGFPLRLTIEAQ